MENAKKKFIYGNEFCFESGDTLLEGLTIAAKAIRGMMTMKNGEYVDATTV